MRNDEMIRELADAELNQTAGGLFINYGRNFCDGERRRGCDYTAGMLKEDAVMTFLGALAGPPVKW